MKLTTIFIAAASLAAAPAASFAQTDPNGPNVPPGDGITMMGTNPEGQAYTPPGYNNGLNVYPDAAIAPGMMAGMRDYPACTEDVKDRCVQTYTKYTSRR